jgi:hypothetical protein
MDAPKRIAGVDYLDPPQQAGWRVTWTVQGALRTATLPPEALKVVEAVD